MSNPFRIGIVGCGNICNAYFKGLGQFPFLEIIGVADIDPARAESKAAEHGVRAFTMSELLAAPDIDLVINLTVPMAHALVNREILAAGKHAYVEKPFALHLDEGRAVLAEAAARDRRVGCAPDTFLGGGIQTARQLIDDGVIGEPVAATANMLSRGPEGWHPNPEFFYKFGGGPMLDMGPYYVTALVNLLGPIRRVTGSSRAAFAERVTGSGPRQGERIGVEVPTHYAGTFDFVAGPIASFNISFDVWSHTLPIIEVYGTEGSLRVPDPNTFGGQVELRRGGEKEWTPVPLTHSDQVGRGIGVADLALAVHEGRDHRASGALALHVLETMLAVQTASERGAHVEIETKIERPAALPKAGLAAEIA